MTRLACRSFLLLIVILVLTPTLGAVDPDSKLPDPKTTTYYKDALPIFKKRCIGCHGGDRPKGDLTLESYEATMRGGDEGVALVAGDPSESLLYLLATGEEKPIMPPKGKGKLTPEELSVLKAWILGGCQAGTVVEAEPYSTRLWPRIYTRPPAIRALSYSKDGSELYVAGFREIVVHALDGKDHRYPSARLVGESEQLNAMELSPDGTLLAAVGGNPARFGELQIWNLKTRQLERFIRVGGDTLYGVAFSPNGEQIAVAGTDRAIHVIEMATGKELYATELHSDWVFGIAFDGDGSKIVSGSRDKTLKVSAASDGKLVSNLANQGGQVLRVARRPGARHVIAGGETKTPVLYDLEKLSEIRKFEAQKGAVLAVGFSGDGQWLAVGGEAAEVRVYKVDDGAHKVSLKVTPWTYAIALNPNGGQLAAAGYDGIVRIFDLESGKESSSFVAVPLGRLMRF